MTGIEGVSSPIWHSLGENLKMPAKIVQFMNCREENDINSITQSVADEVSAIFSQQKEYFIVGHSFGTLLALKLASMLEKRGQMGRIMLIDG